MLPAPVPAAALRPWTPETLPPAPLKTPRLLLAAAALVLLPAAPASPRDRLEPPAGSAAPASVPASALDRRVAQARPADPPPLPPLDQPERSPASPAPAAAGQAGPLEPAAPTPELAPPMPPPLPAEQPTSPRPAAPRPASRPRPPAAKPVVGVVASIQVDLSSQLLIARDASGRTLQRRSVSTGLAKSPTPVGRFRVASRYARTNLVGADYRIEGVTDVMCLAGPGLRPDAICLHPAPWQEAAGQRFGVRRSHGCIRLPSSLARWLFQRTAIGTPVLIQP